MLDLKTIREELTVSKEAYEATGNVELLVAAFGKALLDVAQDSAELREKLAAIQNGEHVDL